MERTNKIAASGTAAGLLAILAAMALLSLAVVLILN